MKPDGSRRSASILKHVLRFSRQLLTPINFQSQAYSSDVLLCQTGKFALSLQRPHDQINPDDR